jgi:7-keto-8-aminopelargonate synthetase-like enzyme
VFTVLCVSSKNLKPLIMAKHNQILDTVDGCITNGVKNKILHLTTDDDYADGRTLVVEGNRLVNFASYSYMGLETDTRLKQGGMEAIEKYGTQFGASRAYISIGLYDKLESLFEKMFSKPVLIAPSTTLAHQAAIPVLIRDEDVIILDQHVHSSVQMTVKIVKSRGVPVELLRHNDLNRLEERIKELKTKHDRIWYMLDGVYSMYGDFAPLKELYALMDKYEQFYCYIDDAHGMSWAGENGTGYVMSQIPFHKQMILLTSLNKAFASAGGAIITPDRETHRRIRTCGGTLIFSTPIQPPMLGVGIAAAKIHLSPEIVTMQEKLHSYIAYCQHLLKKHNLPVVSNDNSPIFYVGTGLPRVGYNLVRKLMDEGFYMSIGLFPAVSTKCTGLRFCVNLHHQIADIENLVEAIAYHHPRVLLEEGKTENEVRKAFKIPLLTEEKIAFVPKTSEQHLKTEYALTIEDIDKAEWDILFKGRAHSTVADLNFWKEHLKIILKKKIIGNFTMLS